LLFKNGEETAEKFLKNWNFQKWKEKYRQIALNGNNGVFASSQNVKQKQKENAKL